MPFMCDSSAMGTKCQKFMSARLRTSLTWGAPAHWLSQHYCTATTCRLGGGCSGGVGTLAITVHSIAEVQFGVCS